MEALNLLESFIQSAHAGSFSEAARRLGLTPAAVSKNVARLESQLGLRLFQRSTRSLTLTEGGRQFLQSVGEPFANLQDAIAHAAQQDGEPSGTLRVSVAVAFGRDYLVPMLGGFLQRYPAIVPDWQFDNRPADLIQGGFDAAIGGGIELTQGVIARQLAQVHGVVAASPAYLSTHAAPSHPAELAQHDGIVRRSGSTGRLRAWVLHDRAGRQVQAECRTRLVFDDPDAMAHAAVLGYGVALLPLPHAARWLQEGRLVRLLPGWYTDFGPLSLYYPHKKLLPRSTQVFIEYIVQAFREQRLAARFDAR